MFRRADFRRFPIKNERRNLNPIPEDDELEKALKRLSIKCKQEPTEIEKKRREKRLNKDLKMLRKYEEMARNRRSRAQKSSGGAEGKKEEGLVPEVTVNKDIKQ